MSEGAIGVQRDSRRGCAHAAAALRLIVLKDAERDINGSKTRAGWTTAVGLLLILIWTVLMLVRHRALRRRPIRLALDIICIALASGAAVAFATGSLAVSPDRRRPFLNKAFAAIRTAGPEWSHIFVLKETSTWFLSESERCIDEFYVASGFVTNGQYDETKFQKLRTIAKLVRESYAPSALYSVSLALCAITSLLIVASIVSALLAVCVKSIPPPDTEAAAPGASAQRQRTRQFGRQNAAAPAMPPDQAVRFFERFIEKVQPPTDGVVLGGGLQSTDCRICLEVMLEEIATLTACNHMFHRRCILQWLVRSNERCCPICREPLKLSANPYHAEDDDDENGTGEHQLVEIPLDNEHECTPATTPMQR